jgi:Skp family chaperone for outer membrane proteins
MMKKYFIFMSLLIFLTLPGCTSHKVEVAPVEIKPIHITIDVNIKVDKALDDFFGDIDETAEKIDETSATTE